MPVVHTHHINAERYLRCLALRTSSQYSIQKFFIIVERGWEGDRGLGTGTYIKLINAVYNLAASYMYTAKVQ